MDDPAVMGSVMNGLLENMKSTPKEQTAVIDQSAVSYHQLRIKFLTVVYFHVFLLKAIYMRQK